MMTPIILLLPLLLLSVGSILFFQNPGCFVSSALFWGVFQHPIISVLTSAIDRESWIIHARHRQELRSANMARATLICWWLLCVSIYILFVNKVIGIGPDLESVILASAPLVVPHELYHTRYFLTMALLVGWREACIGGLHLWLKNGFHWIFYSLFIIRFVATHIAASIGGRRCRMCKRREEELEMEELLIIREREWRVRREIILGEQMEEIMNAEDTEAQETCHEYGKPQRRKARRKRHRRLRRSTGHLVKRIQTK
ncbi:hypothetical protein V8C35DRAFT_169919 [Trichoderma chlorosporum]